MSPSLCKKVYIYISCLCYLLAWYCRKDCLLWAVKKEKVEVDLVGFEKGRNKKKKKRKKEKSLFWPPKRLVAFVFVSWLITRQVVPAFFYLLISLLKWKLSARCVFLSICPESLSTFLLHRLGEKFGFSSYSTPNRGIKKMCQKDVKKGKKSKINFDQNLRLASIDW